MLFTAIKWSNSQKSVSKIYAKKFYEIVPWGLYYKNDYGRKCCCVAIS